jgi:hypothetical protein
MVNEEQKEVPAAQPYVCGTCSHNLRFCYPPSPGGPQDGVDCDSVDMAKEAGLYEDFKEFGCVNLWSVESLLSEVLPNGQGCEFWEAKDHIAVHTRPVRVEAHADIKLPADWTPHNTSITFSVNVKREDIGSQLPDENIKVEVDDVWDDEIS